MLLLSRHQILRLKCVHLCARLAAWGSTIPSEVQGMVFAPDQQMPWSSVSGNIALTTSQLLYVALQFWCVEQVIAWLRVRVLAAFRVRCISW